MEQNKKEEVDEGSPLKDADIVVPEDQIVKVAANNDDCQSHLAVLLPR